MRRRLRISLLVGAALSMGAAAPAQELHRGGPERPAAASDERGAVLLPGGDLFRPLVADPNEPVFFASYLTGATPSRGSGTASVAFGTTVGFVRWRGPGPTDGIQVGLSGGVFAQFDMTKKSHDLINADYIVGFPLTYRRGPYSARFRFYHQSSHLGDEFVESNEVERRNLSFEAFELLVARDFGPFRGYGGGEYRFNRTPHDDLKHGLLHGGVEFRYPQPLMRIARVGALRPVAAIDAKSFEQRDWGVGWSGRAGVEVGPVEDRVGARTVSLLLEIYDGPNPYGQFYFETTSFIGFGAHFTL